MSLTLKKNEILGLVGESGSGKSTTGMMALRLQDPTSGRIWLEGQDITDLSMKELKPLRKRFQVVFQDSHSALDPMYTVERLIAEPLVVHGMRNKLDMRDRTYDIMKRVGLRPDLGPRYAHELSGGQRQRVAIARALI